MTFWPQGEYCDIQSKELYRAMKFARLSGIKVASISGGEPTLCPYNLLELVKTVKETGFPVIRLHTNGLLLNQILEYDGNNLPLWSHLAQLGVNDISVSVSDDREDHNLKIMGIDSIPTLRTTLSCLIENGVRIRLSCYLCPQGIWNSDDINRYIRFAQQYGVKHIIFRKAPTERSQDLAFFRHIIDDLKSEYWDKVSYHEKSDALICVLSKSESAETIMFSCVSEELDNDKKIRRLIYMPDQVLYTSWIDRRSFLFPSDANLLVSSLLKNKETERHSSITVPSFIYQNDGYTIDLHVHSQVSDGLKTPCDVIRAAANSGIHTLVFAEHNCLHDEPIALAAFAQTYGICIPFWGVETSTVFTIDGKPTLKFHLLVYAKSPDKLSFLEKCYNPNSSRNKHLETLYQELKASGHIRASWDEIFQINDPIHTKKKMFTRTPLAWAIADCCGITPDEAKEKYLPQIPDEKRYLTYLDTTNIICLAHDNGCATVLAHPGWIRPYKYENHKSEENLWEAIVQLARDGLDGLEISHRLNDPKHREKLFYLANGLGLIPTGGSDYHGKPRCSFGVNGTTEGNLQLLIDKLQ